MEKRYRFLQVSYLNTTCLLVYFKYFLYIIGICLLFIHERMEITNMQVGFDALLSILSALVGALTVWFTLKNKVAIQQIVLDSMKESLDMVHKRVDGLKDKVESNREKQEKSVADIRDDMAKMKIEIIEAIHAIKSK